LGEVDIQVLNHNEEIHKSNIADCTDTHTILVSAIAKKHTKCHLDLLIIDENETIIAGLADSEVGNINLQLEANNPILVEVKLPISNLNLGTYGIEIVAKDSATKKQIFRSKTFSILKISRKNYSWASSLIPSKIRSIIN
jgi:hypothetical protein